MPTTEMRDALEHVPAAVEQAVQEALGYGTGTTVSELLDMALDFNEYGCYLDMRTEWSELEAATVRQVLAVLQLSRYVSDDADVTHDQLKSAL